MLRTELSAMIDVAQRLTDLGEHAVLSTLFSSKGSTYRPLGSMMVSGVPSLIAGGVSGGCLENYVARVGRSITQEQPAAVLSFDTGTDEDNFGQPVLGCGGAIEILVERLLPRHIDFLRRMYAARECDARSLAVCILESSNHAVQPTFDVTRFWPTDCCGDNDASLAALRESCISKAQSAHGVLAISKGGKLRQALIHYIPPMTRLVILGAGDDARPLCEIARSLGWHVTVADRRTRLATRSRFADADDVFAGDWTFAINQITFTSNTAVVMMTHSVTDDVAILPLLRAKPMFYLGMLGPKHRRDWVLEAASDAAALGGEFAARLHGPIGLNLGDRSTYGIAVSVIAEVLKCLNGRDAKSLSDSAETSLAAIAADRNAINAW